MKRILIVNVNWLGDVIFSTPCIRNIKNAYPNAFIACMIPPRCKDILIANPNLNEIILYDETSHHKGFLGKLSLLLDLKKKKFDTVYFLHRSFTKTLICTLAGIPNRIGYVTKKRSFLLTKKIISPDIHTLHRADYYLELLHKNGITLDNKGCDYYLEEQDINNATSFIESLGITKNTPFIALNPGGNWANKRWPKEHFASLITLLRKQTDIPILLSGAKKDINLTKEIYQIANTRNVHSIAGMLSIRTLAGLFEQSQLIISNDSGPVHIATALKKNVICLFGPTAPNLTGPYKNTAKTVILQKNNEDCPIPCYNNNCKDYVCMSSIEPELVAKEALLMLKHIQIS